MLYVFDIDDTLFKCNFDDSNQIPGDWTWFESAHIFKTTSTPIWPVIYRLHDILNREDVDVIFVTARGDLDDKDLFLSVFHDHGIDMNKIHVYRVGNEQDLPTPQKKARVIRNYIEKGDYSTVFMFDDSINNLEEFLRLRKVYPEIDFIAINVLHNGTTRTIIR